MPRKDHGKPLKTLELQPGSVFRETRTGLDTGTRTWLIDTVAAAKKMPVIGQYDKVYTGMFLEELVVTELELGLTQIVGNFLGMLHPTAPKEETFDEDTDAEYSSSLPTGSIQPVTFMRPIPTVTHTYLSKVKPSQEEVGSHKTPKDYPEVFFSGNQYWLTVSEAQVIFQGWVLIGRTPRRAGRQFAGSIWEVVDTYKYLYHTVEPANFTFEE